MQMYPEQIVKALINESFHSRQMVVGMFVIVNVVMHGVLSLEWP